MKLLQKYLSQASDKQFKDFLENLFEEGVTSGYDETSRGSQGESFEDYSEKNLIDILTGVQTFNSSVDYPHLTDQLSGYFEWTGIHYFNRINGVKFYYSKAQEISKKIDVNTSLMDIIIEYKETQVLPKLICSKTVYMNNDEDETTPHFTKGEIYDIKKIDFDEISLINDLKEDHLWDFTTDFTSHFNLLK